MAERFVRAWKASPTRLQRVVGSGLVTADQILGSPKNKKQTRDVYMTLGSGDETEGRELATSALTGLLTEPTLDSDLAYEYGRVTELILNHAGTPLPGEIDVALTYYLPTEDFGRWNPLLKQLGMPQLANMWATDSFFFPWKKVVSRRVDWPAWTAISSEALHQVAEELAGLRRSALDSIPDQLLSPDPKTALATRDELWTGLVRLREWVAACQQPELEETLGLAKQGNALIMSMDGDQ